MNKKLKNFYSKLLIITLLFSICCTNLAYAKEDNMAYGKDKNIPTQTYTVGDTKIDVFESKDQVKVNVYVNNILDHTSIVNTKDKTVIEKRQGSVVQKSISDIAEISDIESSQNSNIPISYATVSSNYRYIASYTGYIGTPGVYGYLYGYDYVQQGPAKHLSFSKGTIVGSIVGVIVGLIPGINAIAVITALGGAIAGGVIGAYIDGNIYAVDYYTDLMVSVKNIVTLTTYRFTRYAKVLNNKTGRVEQQYIGKYGNWNDNNFLIYTGLQNYAAGTY